MSTTRQRPPIDAIVKKITKRLLPILLLMYVLAFLDRANLGFAKESFQADTGLSDAAYALGAGLFFIGYAIFEVPSNLIMRRVGARFWLARIMISWGVVSALMMFAHDEVTFYILRILLGATEAGFFPGVILYLTLWIPVQHRAKVNGFFYFGPPLAFIIGGPLSGLLLDLDGLGGLAGWQIMFLVTGILTVIVGLVVIGFLDDGPQKAKWLTDAERTTITEAIGREAEAKEGFSPTSWWRALANPVVLYFCVIAFTIQISNYGVNFFLPSQVGAIVGESVGFQVGLLTAIPWIGAIVATFLITRLADRTGRRRLIGSLTLAGAGVGLILSVLTSNPVLALAALSLAAAGNIAVQPIFWTLPTSFLTGAAAASGIALVNSIGNLGGFVAPIARNAAEEAWGAQAGSYFLAGAAFVGAVLLFFSGRLNRGIATISELRADETVSVHLPRRRDIRDARSAHKE